MVNIWEERKKALENEYFYKLEKEQIEKLKDEAHKQSIHELCRNRCPKCSQPLEAITFRGVSLDKCPGCGGVWMGPGDLQQLAEKDHRTWFDKWFKGEAD